MQETIFKNRKYRKKILEIKRNFRFTWWIVRIRSNCWRFLKRTKPTITSLGTTSKSRKNSDNTLAISAKEFWNKKSFLNWNSNFHFSKVTWCTLFENYPKCLIFNSAIFHHFSMKSDLSGNTVWPQASVYQNVNVARFARIVELDFLCDFQTPWSSSVSPPESWQYFREKFLELTVLP